MSLLSKLRKPKKIMEDLGDLIEEHEKLVGVLKSGERSAELKEAKKQGRELKEYKEKRSGNA